MSTNPVNKPSNSPRYNNNRPQGGRGQNLQKRNQTWARRTPSSDTTDNTRYDNQNEFNRSNDPDNAQNQNHQRNNQNRRQHYNNNNGTQNDSQNFDPSQQRKDRKKGNKDKKANYPAPSQQQMYAADTDDLSDSPNDGRLRAQKRLSLAEFHSAVQMNEDGTVQDEEPSRVLWVGNIGPDVSEEELEQEFGQYGKIESLRILHNRFCAFVNFEEESAAKEAKKNLHNTIIGSQYIVIHYRKPELAKQLPTGTGGPDGNFVLNSPSRALWIGNVSDEITEDELKKEFEAFGKIESIRCVARGQARGVLRAKTCAFVNFMNVDEASAALQALQGKKLGNMAIKINFGKPQNAIPRSMNPLDPMNQQFLAPGQPFYPDYYGVPGMIPQMPYFPFVPVMDPYQMNYDQYAFDPSQMMPLAYVPVPQMPPPPGAVYGMPPHQPPPPANANGVVNNF